MKEKFRTFATRASDWLGSPWMFAIVIVAILAWGIWGLIVGGNQVWQLTANTAANIFELIMLVLLQNSQNRTERGLNLKLDELLHANTRARTALADAEDRPEDEQQALQQQYEHTARSQRSDEQSP